MSTLQRAYLRADKPTFDGGGGGGGGGWGVGDFKNILQTDSEKKKIAARKIIPGEKNLLH